MKLRIDKLDDSTGWIINSPSAITENEHKKYISGYESSKSLLIFFSKSDTIKTASKIYGTSFDVTEYNTLIFSIWSQNKSNQIYKKASDFSYKIKINNTKEYYLQCYQTFTNINIGIEELTEINQITITALHSDNDYIVISNMYVEKQEIGFDIINSVKEQIEYEITNEYGNGILIGTGSGNKNDNYITIPNNPGYIDRYSVIYIDDGNNTETHQIEDTDGSKFYINSNFDGNKLLENYTNANIYLRFPVYLNPGQNEIRLPGIAIWGLDPDFILRGNKLDILTDTFRVTENDFKERQDGQILSYTILIDIESRSVSLREKMATVIRKWIEKEILWVNGRYHEIYFESKPTEQRGLEGIDIIQKIQYNLKVEAKEDIYSREIVPKTTDINIDVNIK